MGGGLHCVNFFVYQNGSLSDTMKAHRGRSWARSDRKLVQDLISAHCVTLGTDARKTIVSRKPSGRGSGPISVALVFLCDFEAKSALFCHSLPAHIHNRIVDHSGMAVEISFARHDPCLVSGNSLRSCSAHGRCPGK